MVTDNFVGMVTLGSVDFSLFVQITTTNGVPISPDGNINYLIYSEAGGAALLSGTFPLTPVQSKVGFYVITGLQITEANGFAAGQTYTARIDYEVSSGTDQVQLQRFTVN